MSTTPLPTGWRWKGTDVDFHWSAGREPLLDNASTTVVAKFEINDLSIPPIYPYSGSVLQFQPELIDAKWNSVDDDYQLVTISINGPMIVKGVSTSRLTRRGTYTAFRNEIALARADAPAGRSAAIPAHLVHALDAWAAHEGNIPLVVVQ